MKKIPPNFTNTTVEGVPLGANLVSRANHFLENLPPYKGFRALPLMSNSAGCLEAMLLIPESQMKDLIIPPKLINRAINALNDRWHGRNTDELIFRSVKVNPNGDLGDKTELVTFSRKALLTVLSDKKNLFLIKDKSIDARYSSRNVLEAYKKVQVLSAALSATSGSSAAPIINDLTTEQEGLLARKEQDLLVKEREVSQKERQLAEQERKLQEQASQLEQERQRLTVLEQKIRQQLNVPPPASPEVINTGLPNNNPDDADRQKLLRTGVSVGQASKHAEYATY